MDQSGDRASGLRHFLMALRKRGGDEKGGLQDKHVQLTKRANAKQSVAATVQTMGKVGRRTKKLTVKEA